MEMTINGRFIRFDKELNELDKLALHFSQILSEYGIDHVFLSGYVAILFGRSRASEDIYVVSKKVPVHKFNDFWEYIHRNLECIITSDVQTAFNEYLLKGTAIRFAYQGEFIPNVEMKFEATKMHKTELTSPLNVLVNGRNLPISPLEQQIAYKLFMGSEKDIEDARFLFKLFDENLDKQKIIEFLTVLDIPIEQSKTFLGWSD